MLVQVNTDNHVNGPARFAEYVEGELRQALARFSSMITRIEVHLHDTNADKAGATDKRCTLEARVSGRDPIAVSHSADRVEVALAGARDKLVRLLNRQVDKARPPKGQDPFDAVMA
jgi:ribosome-associated translation inhibitor RaiA